jgi:hypothetical protein
MFSRREIIFTTQEAKNEAHSFLQHYRENGI